jgi:hypothetical protein
VERPEETDTEEQVPARVKAREGRELVREPGRLKRSVRVRPFGHRIDQAEVEQARWCDGEQREEQEADQPGREDRVAEHDVLGPPGEEEERRDGEDHGPVPPDVDPVRDVDERLGTRHTVLERVLVREAEFRLEVDQVPGVRVRCGRAADRDVAHAEVQQHRPRDQRDLAGERRPAFTPLAHHASFHAKDAATTSRRHRYRPAA